MRIGEFFEREKIEYFAVLPYEACKETKGYLISREGFVPQSVIIYLLPYYTGEAENLSIYASSLDYHIAISEINNRLVEFLKGEFPENHYKGYGDHSPIDERHAALICGLGVLGENGLLINEKYGTYVFIGDLVTDVPTSLLGESKIQDIKRCGGCSLCKHACPTGILRGDGCDCLSAITQRKGELSEKEVDLMRKFNTVWGCDLCQRACPYNKNPKLTPLEFFYEDKISKLTSDALSAMQDDEFSKRAFSFRGRGTVERNLKKLGY